MWQEGRLSRISFCKWLDEEYSGHRGMEIAWRFGRKETWKKFHKFINILIHAQAKVKPTIVKCWNVEKQEQFIVISIPPLSAHTQTKLLYLLHF